MKQSSFTSTTVGSILTVDGVVHNAVASSQKRALELLSSQLCLYSGPDNNFSADDVFDSLCQRERLGSTAIGSGVALPHCRNNWVPKVTAACLLLRNGVDFAAFDKQPVDLIFGVIVPEEENSNYLQLISNLAEKFRNKEFLHDVRSATNNLELHARLIQ